MEEQSQQEEAASTPEELQPPQSSTLEFISHERSGLDATVDPDQVKEELQEKPLASQESKQQLSPPFQAPQELILVDQNGQTLQLERMVILTGQSQSGQVYIIPANQLTGSHVLIPQSKPLDINETNGSHGQKVSNQEPLQTLTLTAVGGIAGNAASETTTAKSNADSFVSPLKPLPRNAPSWALRLRSCEKIGDSYRGYCSTEAELEAVLLLHKQQTGAVFGTRQSPSPAKPATRLMWKSQYVPYDGIPFVNAGSRAIVMECQFGPRRKGLQPKFKFLKANYKATCPARIYIKKVRKFPEQRVPTDPKVDKKVVRQEQEKAFFNLRKGPWDVGGVIRYYVQLPTQKAHLYHDMEAPPLPPPPVSLGQSEEDEGEGLLLGAAEEEEEEEEEEDASSQDDGSCVPSRLHPLVAEKITQLVAQGHSQVYAVRKQLRKYVEREMFRAEKEKVPERHNLCYFPTVNDIKNHIHEAQKTLQQQQQGQLTTHTDPQWAAEGDDLLTETVTLTLTPASAEAVEGSDTLSPEAVQLFSSLTSLQPKIFAQLQGIQLPVSSSSSPDGALSNQSPSSSSSLSASTGPVCPTGPAPELLEHHDSPHSSSLAPPSSSLRLGPHTQSLLPSGTALVEAGGSVTGPPAGAGAAATVLDIGHLVSVASLGLGASVSGLGVGASEGGVGVSVAGLGGLSEAGLGGNEGGLRVSVACLELGTSEGGLGVGGSEGGLGESQGVVGVGPGQTMHQLLLEDGQTIPVRIVNPATIALAPSESSVKMKDETEDNSINTDIPAGD
ncbi:calcium-responsive transcription factor [Engraulis encrasicolus]|uniref:calcium-responsive transcription factor n=1 Tax=Engraulis encrasicolus TaxID=184585 RepID=UPI002FD4D545